MWYPRACISYKHFFHRESVANNEATCPSVINNQRRHWESTFTVAIMTKLSVTECLCDWKVSFVVVKLILSLFITYHAPTMCNYQINKSNMCNKLKKKKERTTTSHFKSLNTEKTTIYVNENPNLGNNVCWVRAYGGVSAPSWFPTPKPKQIIKIL